MAAGSLLGLAGYLCRYRRRPGAVWFIATLSMQALWCFFYGLGLLIPDQPVRIALEQLSWVGLGWIGILFMGFALDYTGRSSLRQSIYYYGLWIIPVGGTILVLTNPSHNLIWDNAMMTTALGAVAVDYDVQFWGFVFISSGILFAGVGVVLLVNAVFSYGELYRKEATAVAVSTVPVTIGLLVWLFDIGPTSVLNWGVVMSLPHAVLDAYAFARTEMFESNPATRRRANEEAIDTIPDPVLIVDDSSNIIDYNDRAAEIFPILSNGSIRGMKVDDLPLGDPVPEADTEQPASVVIDQQRYEFVITSSELVDPQGTVLGHTVLFRDVKDEREREQRLEVLNRVLRHNIRNKLTVILGSADSIQASTEDETIAQFAEWIQEGGASLEQISEKARDFDTLRERETAFRAVDIVPVVEAVLSKYETQYASTTVERGYSGAHEVLTDPYFLEYLLDNLVENAFEHGNDSEPHVTVSITPGEGTGESITIEIEDRGPGIPVEELDVIRSGTESQLEHASGIGLWIVSWCATRIDASLAVETDDRGSTVSVHLPADPFGDES
jgi:signal transduction histidine kinase